MRRIVFSLIVLLALLLAAEVAVTFVGQSGMERALRSQHGLPDDLQADINSFPFLVGLARNHLAELQFTWSGELPFHAGDGALENIAYSGRANLFDVELCMTSLLAGRLEIRNLSRIRTSLGFGLEDLNEALAVGDGGFLIQNGRIYGLRGGEKARYRVKVSGKDELTLEPHGVYTDGISPAFEAHAQVETLRFHMLPLRSSLRKASIIGDMVVVEIYIPMWEGYL